MTTLPLLSDNATLFGRRPVDEDEQQRQQEAQTVDEMRRSWRERCTWHERHDAQRHSLLRIKPTEQGG